MKGEIQISIRDVGDIVVARQQARVLADLIGFAGSDQGLISIAVSQLARYAILNGRRGTIGLASLRDGQRRGIRIVMRDSGPRVADVQKTSLAERTIGGFGELGLRTVREFMDEFEVRSEAAQGKTISVQLWVREVEAGVPYDF